MSTDRVGEMRDKRMQSDVFGGFFGVLLIAGYVAPPLWVAWYDFRKHCAQMHDRAEDYHARGNVEDEARDTEPERGAWGMRG